MPNPSVSGINVALSVCEIQKHHGNSEGVEGEGTSAGSFPNSCCSKLSGLFSAPFLNPGAFIVCWLPFFLIHILNAHCPSCHVPPGLYSASTWLGYVNSALNPIIYTTFNTDFRKAFLKILCC